jgi:Flp pilus assembly protein TadG
MRRPRFAGERGQSLVEFVLVLPIFLVLIMATIDFGWALRSWITATNSAREGARIGVTGANISTIKERVVDSSSKLLSTGDVFVTNAQGDSGEDVEVLVKFDYEYITPIGGLISFLTGGTLPSPLPISSKTVMRLE